jgi:hypothetical protein
LVKTARATLLCGLVCRLADTLIYSRRYTLKQDDIMTTTLEVNKVTLDGDFKANGRPKLRVTFRPDLPFSELVSGFKPFQNNVNYVLENYIVHGNWRIEVFRPRAEDSLESLDKARVSMSIELRSGAIPDLDPLLKDAKAIADSIPIILLEWGDFYQKTAERLTAMGFNFKIESDDVQLWLNDQYARVEIAIMRSLTLSDGATLGEGAPMGLRHTFALNDFNEAEVKAKLLEYERKRQEKHKEYEVSSVESTAWERSRAAKKANQTKDDNNKLTVLRRQVIDWKP